MRMCQLGFDYRSINLKKEKAKVVQKLSINLKKEKAKVVQKLSINLKKEKAI